jgi:rhodanese-related sulfurtransferase
MHLIGGPFPGFADLDFVFSDPFGVDPPITGVLAATAIRPDGRGMKLTAIVACLVLAAPLFAVEETEPVKVEQAEKQIADGEQLLDVRTESEWKEGHLKGAKLVTLSKDGFVEKAKAVLDPKKPVLVYCKSGGRSAKAAKQLREAGFTVHDLDGGITAWQKAGKPVVK